MTMQVLATSNDIDFRGQKEKKTDRQKEKKVIQKRRQMDKKNSQQKKQTDAQKEKKTDRPTKDRQLREILEGYSLPPYM